MKTIDEVDLIDDMFMNLVASDPDVGEIFCRTLLSVLLQKDIGSVKVLSQRMIPGTYEGMRGIRLDVEVTETSDKSPELIANVYDIEPHTSKEPDMFRMMRFRQAKIDSRFMKSGDNDFSHLPDLYVILITNFDPFGEDYMLYTINNSCAEVPTLSCDDGLKFLYFNTIGRKGGSDSIRNVLEYMQNSRKSSAVDTATKEIDKCVDNVRHDPAIRGKYMTFGDKLDREFLKGKEIGQQIGEQKILIRQICSKMSKGMSISEIAEELETDEAKISIICDVARKHAPEYDQNAILEELQSTMESALV